MSQAAATRTWRPLPGIDAGPWWRGLTVASLLVGYAGYYVCRSNLSVAAPLIAADPSIRGLSTVGVGAIASAGVLAYAAGKPLTGIGGDILGGRRMFLAGMWGAVAATLAFGAGGGALALGAAWVANRFIQSTGWGALTKLVAQWFEPERHGRVIAVLSLSYLFGDAAARLALGAMLDAGAGWRALFAASAAILAVIAVGVGVILRERPADRGLPAPAASPHTVYGDAVAAADVSASALVRPLLASPSFWLVCALSCGLTLVREAFNIWTPTFLSVTYAMPPGEAARWSALFPFMGGVSVVAVGVVSDHLGAGRRMQLAAPLVLLAGLLAFAASSGIVMHDVRLGLAVVGAIALFLIGPYSLLAGAIALELGGTRGASTAAGLIDTAGYLGALLSGVAIGAAAEAQGWHVSLRWLGAIMIGAAVVAAGLAWTDARRLAAADRSEGPAA